SVCVKIVCVHDAAEAFQFADDVVLCLANRIRIWRARAEADLLGNEFVGAVSAEASGAWRSGGWPRRLISRGRGRFRICGARCAGVFPTGGERARGSQCRENCAEPKIAFHQCPPAVLSNYPTSASLRFTTSHATPMPRAYKRIIGAMKTSIVVASGVGVMMA